jgi:hypothetical protein
MARSCGYTFCWCRVLLIFTSCRKSASGAACTPFPWEADGRSGMVQCVVCFGAGSVDSRGGGGLSHYYQCTKQYVVCQNVTCTDKTMPGS